MKKKCSKCNELKELTEFNKAKTGRDGHRSDCKVCFSSYKKAYDLKNKERRKEYLLKNTEELKRKRRLYYLKNKEEKKLKQREYNKHNKDIISLKNRNKYKDNKDKFRLKTKEYRKNNPEKIRALNNKHRAKKKQAIPQWYNSKEVLYIYTLAQEKGLEVDHLVPLNSKHVCGLHVQDNLRCVSKELNRYKRNKYWPDMWEN